MTTRLLRYAGAVLAAALCFLAAKQAWAQASAADSQFLNDIVEATNGIDAETAREGHARCLALEEKLKQRADVEPLQRLYFEMELEGCMFQAKNNGRFSDERGDACRHHFSYAEKLAQVISRGVEKKIFTAEFVRNLGERLENAISWAPQFGCAADYSGFAPAAAAAKAAADVPAPEPDFALWQDIMDARSAIAPETARHSQMACTGLAAGIAAKPGRPDAEKAFLEGLIENCIAAAMEQGKYSDTSGDTCSHHFTYASKVAEALKLLADEPLYAMQMEPILAEELRVAKEQGALKGCKQDYGSLRGP